MDELEWITETPHRATYPVGDNNDTHHVGPSSKLPVNVRNGCDRAGLGFGNRSNAGARSCARRNFGRADANKDAR
jgi:hypothetical protein